MSKLPQRSSLALVALATVSVAVASACSSSTKSSNNSSTPRSDTSASAASCGGKVDTSLDSTLGQGAGQMQRNISCATTKPLKASGAAIKVGLTNSNGDPSFSFPDYTDGVRAAVNYINNDLGGVGGDPASGKAGRPIDLITCDMQPTAASAKSCATKIASAKPIASLDGLDTFADQVYPLETQSGIVPLSGWPSIDANTKNPKVFAVVPGGAGIGLVGGLASYTLTTLHAKNIAVEIDNNPGGLALFNNIIKPAYDAAGVKYKEVLVPQGTSAWTSLSSQILSAKPDAILGIMAPSECWNTVTALSQQGWDPKASPFVMASTCKVQDSVKAAGASAVGVTFVGANDTASPDLYSGLTKLELSTYLDQYKKVTTTVPPDTFSGAGFQAGIAIYETLGNYLSSSGGKLDASGYGTYLSESKDLHQWGDVPWGCSTAPSQFPSICAVKVSAIQWDGSRYKVVKAAFDPIAGLHL